MNPLDYCQQQVAPAGSELYYSLLFAEQTKRQAALALYTFGQTLAAIGYECQDETIALAKLHWWLSEINALYNDHPTHPVTQALQLTQLNQQLPQEIFISWINAEINQLTSGLYTDYTTWQQAIYAKPSGLKLVASYVFGNNNTALINFVHELDLCCCLIDSIDYLARDVQHNRLQFSLADLEMHQVDIHMLKQRHTTQELQQLLNAQAERARNAAQAAYAALPARVTALQLPQLILLRLRLALLDEIAANNFNVLAEQVRLTPLRKCWLAYRTKWGY